MAVTLTAVQLMAALRITDTDETEEITRLLAVYRVVVEKYAPAAPAAIQNEALIRLAGYLYDKPTAPRGTGYSRALTNSGAAGLLLPYRTHRAGPVAEGTESTSTGDVPPVGPGGPGVDAEARRLAALAESTATEALNKANEAINDIGDLLPQVAANSRPPTATEQEATQAVSKNVRSWTPALLRRLVEAVRPSGTSQGGTALIKATNTDVDNESDDTRYVTVAKLFRGINRKVKNASQTVRGIVLLARNDDVENETDLTRVPTLAHSINLWRRLRNLLREVPATPGSDESVTQKWVLTVHGKNDKDYRWERPTATGDGGGDIGNAEPKLSHVNELGLVHFALDPPLLEYEYDAQGQNLNEDIGNALDAFLANFQIRTENPRAVTGQDDFYFGRYIESDLVANDHNNFNLIDRLTGNRGDRNSWNRISGKPRPGYLEEASWFAPGLVGGAVGGVTAGITGWLHNSKLRRNQTVQKIRDHGHFDISLKFFPSRQWNQDVAGVLEITWRIPVIQKAIDRSDYNALVTKADEAALAADEAKAAVGTFQGTLDTKEPLFIESQNVGLVNFSPDPAVFTYKQASEFERTFRIRVDNPENIPGDLWYERAIGGINIAGRAKWDPNGTYVIDFPVTKAQAATLEAHAATDGTFTMLLTFFALARGGVSQASIRITVGVIKQVATASATKKIYTAPNATRVATDQIFDAGKAPDTDSHFIMVYLSVDSSFHWFRVDDFKAVNRSNVANNEVYGVGQDIVYTDASRASRSVSLSLIREADGNIKLVSNAATARPFNWNFVVYEVK